MENSIAGADLNQTIGPNLGFEAQIIFKGVSNIAYFANVIPDKKGYALVKMNGSTLLVQ